MAFLTYYGLNVANCIVMGNGTADELYHDTLDYISFTEYPNETASNVPYPVAINGVTIHSTLDEVEQNLRFLKQSDDTDTQKGIARFSYESSEMSVKVFVSNNVVSNITIQF